MSWGQAEPVLTHGRARTLAALWSVEPDSILAHFAATGEISRSLIEAVHDDLRRLEAAAALGSAALPPRELRSQLRALLGYLQAYGERGPMTGWGQFPDTGLWAEDSGFVAPPAVPGPDPPGRSEELTSELEYEPGWDRD